MLKVLFGTKALLKRTKLWPSTAVVVNHFYYKDNCAADARDGVGDEH